MTKKGHLSDRSSKRAPRARTRLFLEALEDRTLLSVTLLSHYNGINFNTSQGYVPPDTAGAAGPNSYVETTNQEVAIFSPKTTGTKKVSDALADFYFTQGRLPNADSTSSLSDPVVTWDEKIQRFIVVDQDVDFGTHVSNFDIAVSKTANPTTLTRADWNFSFVSTTESGFDADYPGNLGWNADSLVFTLNMFPTGASPFHVQVDSVDIKALVNGTPLSLGTNAFANDFAGGSLRPTVMHDSKAGDPMWLVQEAGNGTDIDVVKMTKVLSSAATFTTTAIAVTPYSRAVPELQPNGLAITTNTDSRIMKAAMQGGELVAAHQVSNALGNLDKVQWYEINTTGATPTLTQQGDITGGVGTYLAYPGIDINPAGDIGISYISSGTAKGAFMSTYITGRTPTDAKGTMETSQLVQAGAGNYSDFSPGREGDLSGINVDSDGSFWISNEFANTNAFANWGTTIAHFSFGPSIPPIPGVSITGRVFQDQSHSGKEVPSDPGLAGVTVYIDAANVGHYVNGDPAVITAADGTYKFHTLAPGSYLIGAVVQANFAQSSPTGGTEQPVGVSANSTAFAVDFGDYKLGPYTTVDDSSLSGNFKVFGSGWKLEAGGVNNENLYHSSLFAGPATYAQWTTTAAVPGRAGTYELYASWVAKINNATNATYQIFDQPTDTLLGTVTVDQTQAPTQANVNGTLFQELGTFTSSNGSFIIQLQTSGISGNVPVVNVVADAIVEASPVTLPQVALPAGPSSFGSANSSGPGNLPNLSPNGSATSPAGSPSTASLDNVFIHMGNASNGGASSPTTAVLSSNGPASASGAFSATVTHALTGADTTSIEDLLAGLGPKKQGSRSTGNAIAS